MPRRNAATCSDEPEPGAGAVAASIPVCVSMASDGSLSDYGDGALNEAQNLLNPAGGDQVLRVGAQRSGPSTVRPMANVIDVVA